EAFEGVGHSIGVGAGLIAGEDVVDAAEVVGAAEDLEAAILAGGGVDGDEGAGEEREQDAVLIPVAVVLMPGPGATDAGVLHDHLGVVMVDLAFEDLLGGGDDRFRA